MKQTHPDGARLAVGWREGGGNSIHADTFNPRISLKAYFRGNLYFWGSTPWFPVHCLRQFWDSTCTVVAVVFTGCGTHRPGCMLPSAAQGKVDEVEGRSAWNPARLQGNPFQIHSDSVTWRWKMVPWKTSVYEQRSFPRNHGT